MESRRKKERKPSYLLPHPTPDRERTQRPRNQNPKLGGESERASERARVLGVGGASPSGAALTLSRVRLPLPNGFHRAHTRTDTPSLPSRPRSSQHHNARTHIRTCTCLYACSHTHRYTFPRSHTEERACG